MKSMLSLMSTEITKKPTARVREIGSQQEDGSETEALARWLDAGVAAMASASAAASILGMRDSHLSEARRSQRPISFTRIIRLMREDPAFTAAFLAAMADDLQVKRTAKTRAIRAVRQLAKLRQTLDCWDDDHTDPSVEIAVGQ